MVPIAMVVLAVAGMDRMEVLKQAMPEGPVMEIVRPDILIWLVPVLVNAVMGLVVMGGSSGSRHHQKKQCDMKNHVESPFCCSLDMHFHGSPHKSLVTGS